MAIEKVADEIIQLSEYILNHPFTHDVITSIGIAYAIIFGVVLCVIVGSFIRIRSRRR